ncbi:hypothetical protein [Nocardia farcinica]|uniref:hypothetical protein n=1 Tax=Nocardia farcinica TaxID=37329 RepID=UPI0018930A5A|nr:hypothetical protein [Nocardia farcinica]MBF6070144.1 hypothetical protein [Nocardia farcinica]
MTTYVVGLEVWGAAHDSSNFGGGGGRERTGGARTLHAVAWPDPAGREWRQLETVCGKSTREYRIQQAPAAWPPQRTEDMCPKCRDGASATG